MAQRSTNPFLKFKFIGEQVFKVNVERALRQVGDLSVPFRLISDDFYKSEEAVFSLRGPGGFPPFQGRKIGARKFARTIPKRFDSYTYYQYRKEKDLGFAKGYPLLVRTGRLADSVTSGQAAESILTIGPKTLVIGTTVPYADYHQSDAARKVIPLRKFLFIAPESRNAPDALSGRLARWSNIINQYVLRSLGATLGEATGKG